MLFYGNGGILCLKGSNVFGRHTNNETTNRFGWGNTAKAQKVETSIEVRIAHQARLNFVVRVDRPKLQRPVTLR